MSVRTLNLSRDGNYSKLSMYVSCSLANFMETPKLLGLHQQLHLT